MPTDFRFVIYYGLLLPLYEVRQIKFNKVDKIL